jgi:RnfABCDGE-type electron transport complex B subunit
VSFHLVLLSAAILGGLGLSFGALIALAQRKLWVWEDPRIEGVHSLLPGANCSACGHPGCRGFAEAVVAGKSAPAECTVMSTAEREVVAAYLGVDVGQAVQRVARLLCAGGSDVAPRKAVYRGIESCAAAVAVGGGKACAWGCVGLADCAVACEFAAIEMSAANLPVVVPEKCTACGDCVEACPLDLFVIMPIDQKLIVQCRNLLAGEAATAVCSVACNACARCVVDAAPGVVAIVDGLAVVDYRKNALAAAAATGRCPTGAIAWVEGAQFGARARIAESVAA